MTQPTERRVISLRAERACLGAGAFLEYYSNSTYAKRKQAGQPPRFDFVTGTPFEMPLPGLVSALAKAVQPKNATWYAYHLNEKASCDIVAASLSQRLGIRFDPEDIMMTAGGFAALAVSLKLVTDPGDQVVVNTPYFFFYPTVLETASVETVKVPLGPSFELDLPALRRAIGPRTRAVLINSPHNPSGRLVRREEMTALAEILTEASRIQGRPVYLLSDEAFSRLVYDGVRYESPTSAYPHSILLYTYGKTLMAPGERLGYIALPHAMPEADRRALREPLVHLSAGNGWCFPSSTLQHALPEIDQLSIDVSYLQGNRDLFRDELRKAGYDVVVPEGTFFMLVRSPIPDDVAYAEILAQNDIFITPASMCLAPGYLRVSLCALRETVRDSIDGWTRAIQSLPGRGDRR